MHDFSAQTVLITGASRGIGAAAARRFAAGGANVVLAARGLVETRAIAEEIGGRAVACDVSRYDDMANAVSVAVEAYGGLDVIVLNAGAIEPIAHLGSANPEAWGRVIDVNLKGAFYGMHAALPVMEAAGGGTVILISSGAAHGPVEAWSHYCSSKAGAAMLVRCLDKEYRGKGIRAMGLSPGTVATEMQREIKASGINPVSQLAWEDHIPPEWPAEALAWMAGPAGDGLLGQEVSLREEAVRRAVGLID